MTITPADTAHTTDAPPAPPAPHACAWHEACRARALQEFAATPDLASWFARPESRCHETDTAKARACAASLGFVEETP